MGVVVPKISMEETTHKNDDYYKLGVSSAINESGKAFKNIIKLAVIY